MTTVCLSYFLIAEYVKHLIAAPAMAKCPLFRNTTVRVYAICWLCVSIFDSIVILTANPHLKQSQLKVLISINTAFPVKAWDYNSIEIQTKAMKSHIVIIIT